ncbi:hypothetical protein scyTo_0019555 [Scyliorhinus torazame]|uniref:Uncharacterized protein n=1 Tax=Scyliorhinus torazame TaxID=75743 RepID=A0A401Q2B6_SCYTO|nr:hypothetical protein [Scyliorhinus torazame]
MSTFRSLGNVFFVSNLCSEKISREILKSIKCSPFKNNSIWFRVGNIRRSINRETRASYVISPISTRKLRIRCLPFDSMVDDV